ncbi:hypothetical protein FQR65_LT13863 [Abscondita terminalis]|nr:hypothetical protein FQR65_LT13863 [Abscondita terminalis]
MDCPLCNSDHSSQSQEDVNDLSSILYQSSEKRSKPIDYNLMQKLGLTYDDLAELLPQEEVNPLTKSEPNPETPPPQAPVERIPVLSFSTDVSKDIIHDFNKQAQLYQKSVQGTSESDGNEEPCAKCFQYLLDHEDYPLDDYEQVTVSIRSPSGNSEKRKREMLELQKDLKMYRESIPADAGLPLTTPRRSAIPKRPMSLSIERDMDLDSTPPLRFHPKKTSTPKSRCCHSNNQNIYRVSTPQESTPFRKMVKTTFTNSKNSNTDKSKKKTSQRQKNSTKQGQQKKNKSPLTKKVSPVLTTILPKRPMERVVSEVFERRPEEIKCCSIVTSSVEAEPNAIEVKPLSPFRFSHPMFKVESHGHQNKRFNSNASHSPVSNHITPHHDWGDQSREKQLNEENIVLIENESNHERSPLPTLIEIESNEEISGITSKRYEQKPEQTRQIKFDYKEVLKTKAQNSQKKLQNEQEKTNKRMSLHKAKKLSSNETIEDFYTPRSSLSNENKSKRYGKPKPVKHVPLKKVKANSVSIAPFSYLPKVRRLYDRDQVFTTPKQRSAPFRNRKSIRFHCRSRPLMHIDSLTDISSSESKQLVQPVATTNSDFRKSIDNLKKPGYSRSDKKDSFGKRMSSPNDGPCRTMFKKPKLRRMRRSVENLNALNSSKYPSRFLNHEGLRTNSFMNSTKTFAKYENKISRQKSCFK